MRWIVLALWGAGGIELAIFAANFYVPRKLDFRKGIAGAPTMIRQVFFVHAGYVAGVVLLFALMSFLFAPELASGRGLGRFLSAAICIFWACRVPLQVFYYDREVRRANRAGDLAMTAALVYLAATYGAAALGMK
ncbi:MAG TPA: hypothetical protein VFO34_03315 [Candidatus Acidoferrales bacterium]|nr:hypothetical protein [Candidatus Acidoferrales bacterium]